MRSPARRCAVALVCAMFATSGAVFPQAPSPQADRLISGWIRVAGGPRVWDNVRTIEYTITTVWLDSAGHEVRRRPRDVWIQKLDAGFRARVERSEPTGRFVQVWDGRRSWATRDGQLIADTAQANRETPYVTAELLYWMGLPWKLRDPGVHLNYIEPNMVYVTFGEGVGLHDGDRYWHVWEDPRSGFPTYVDYIEQGKTENDRHRLIWSEWTRFGPAVYPARRLLLDARGRALRAFLIDRVRVNAPLPDSLFRRP